jgi:glycosyltransferase involved in cell wall biosynthesis
MIKVLVAVEDYVGENRSMSHRFVHVRNLYYQKNGIDVTVLNFSTDENYTFEGIRVISLKTYEANHGEYDLLICHQANIRHHSIFLKKYGKYFPHFIFFFHGHEVLKINKTYSKPYPYMKNTFLKKNIQNLYDDYKLAYWRKYFLSVIDKTTFVFVSEWMLNEFVKWVKIPLNRIKNSYMITYNCIGEAFEQGVYDNERPKEYDFITIRNNLDGSKYCIDFVNELAKNNPKCKFLLVGMGEFFEHYPISENIVWKNQTMGHAEIIRHLQMARCALMPTRTDAQGLMMCEMASTGMPLITSDIPVCHEVFDDFTNVKFISNNESNIDLLEILRELEKFEPYSKNDKYNNSNTSQAEVDLINRLIRGN